LIEVIVPGWQELRLTALVLDVNGTLALDGELLPDVDGRLTALRAKVDIHLLSADTYGRLDGRPPRDRSRPPEVYHSRDRCVRVWVPRAVPVLLTRSTTHTA
jgi:hypothetical protein